MITAEENLVESYLVGDLKLAAVPEPGSL